MSLAYNYSEHDKTLKITIRGRFDFAIQKEFRETYRNREQGVRYLVDLNDTDYMDSSALGMLLLLRKHAGGDDADVTVSGANEGVKKILNIAKFDQLFTIT